MTMKRKNTQDINNNPGKKSKIINQEKTPDGDIEEKTFTSLILHKNIFIYLHPDYTTSLKYLFCISTSKTKENVAKSNYFNEVYLKQIKYIKSDWECPNCFDDKKRKAINNYCGKCGQRRQDNEIIMKFEDKKIKITSQIIIKLNNNDEGYGIISIYPDYNIKLYKIQLDYIKELGISKNNNYSDYTNSYNEEFIKLLREKEEKEFVDKTLSTTKSWGVVYIIEFNPPSKSDTSRNFLLYKIGYCMSETTFKTRMKKYELHNPKIIRKYKTFFRYHGNSFKDNWCPLESEFHRLFKYWNSRSLIPSKREELFRIPRNKNKDFLDKLDLYAKFLNKGKKYKSNICKEKIPLLEYFDKNDEEVNRVHMLETLD